MMKNAQFTVNVQSESCQFKYIKCRFHSKVVKNPALAFNKK